MNLTVGSNYHVYIKRYHHYYSAPYRYCHKRCKVICTATHVSIYLDGEQIAFHLRDYSSNRYTTNPEHMPEKDKYVIGLSPENLLERGKQIGPEVQQYIQAILNKPVYIQQAFRSCEGVLSCGRKAGKDRLIAACRRGIMFNVYTYGFIKNTLNSHLDNEQLVDQKSVQYTLPLHENIRGAQNYK
jgi:hypothetical protein